MSDTNAVGTALVGGAIKGIFFVGVVILALYLLKIALRKPASKAKEMLVSGVEAGRHIIDQAKDRVSGIPDASASDSDELYAAAYQEAMSDSPEPASWAKAFAHASGDEAKAKALYVKYRVGKLRRVAAGKDH